MRSDVRQPPYYLNRKFSNFTQIKIKKVCMHALYILVEVLLNIFLNLIKQFSARCLLKFCKKMSLLSDFLFKILELAFFRDFLDASF